MNTTSQFRILLLSLTLFLVVSGSSVTQGELIDDFGDGVINADIWWYGGGNYAGGEGWGNVYETNGQLVLDCIDIGRGGAGVCHAILRSTPVDVPVYFSFELTMDDDTLNEPYLGGNYTPDMTFRVAVTVHSNLGQGMPVQWAMMD